MAAADQAAPSCWAAVGPDGVEYAWGATAPRARSAAEFALGGSWEALERGGWTVRACERSPAVAARLAQLDRPLGCPWCGRLWWAVAIASFLAGLTAGAYSLGLF